MTESLSQSEAAKTIEAPASVSRLRGIVAVVTLLLAYLGLAFGIPVGDAASRSGELGAYGVRQSEHLAARDDGRPVATVHRAKPKGVAPPSAPVLIETASRFSGLLSSSPVTDHVWHGRSYATVLRDTNQPRAPPILLV